MTRRATLRASDADREQVAERLRHAAAEGRLHGDELEDRLGTALSARTYGELDAVVSDLPTTSVGRRGSSRDLAGLQPAGAAAIGISIALLLAVGAALAVGGHSHPDHRWVGGLGGGLPLLWLVWLAIGWRFFAHPRDRAR
jgi:hypothetical protein